MLIPVSVLKLWSYKLFTELIIHRNDKNHPSKNIHRMIEQVKKIIECFLSNFMDQQISQTKLPRFTKEFFCRKPYYFFGDKAFLNSTNPKLG